MRSISSKAKTAPLLLFALCWQLLAAQEVKVRNIYGAAGSSFIWKVYIDESPTRLQLIRCVEYTLYPTFPNPVREVCDAKDHFALEEKGKGEFTLGLKIEWSGREATVQSYNLDLHSNNIPKVSRDPILNGVRPTGMAFLESGNLVFADQSMGDILLRKSGGFVSIGKVQADTDPQVCPIKFKGNTAIAVAYTNKSFFSTGYVRVLNSDGGHDLAFWIGRQYCHLAGCAWDGSGNALDVVDNSPQLTRLQFDGRRVTSTSHGIAGIDTRDSHLLIVADFAHGDLLAADATSGNLYRIDLQNDHAHGLTLTGTIGQPRAIALSADGETLYSVDGKHIRRVRLDTTPAQASIFFVEPNTFKDLSSVAIGADGQIWVGDSTVHAIYIVSPGGQVTSVLSAR
jgi:DNA-binding beta-propeller fold protein YncE